jgi:chaperonin GroES
MSSILFQEVEADEQKTATGLFLPSSATSSPLPEATVIAVGPGAPNKEGGTSFSYRGKDRADRKEYHLFKDQEILAKINE